MNDGELLNFIAESNRIEGINRPPSAAEFNEARRFLEINKLMVPDLIAFVKIYQPNAVLRDRPGLDVRVGNHIAPSGGQKILNELTDIVKFANAGRMTPYELHHLYENLHPFTDGNGRSGRILWLWMMKGRAPLGFLHHWYYQSLDEARKEFFYKEV